MLLKILFFKLIFHYIHPNFTSAQNTLKFKSFDSWNHFMPHTKHRTIAKLLRASGSVDIYFITHNFNAVTKIMWTRRVIGMTRVCLINKRQSSTTFYDEKDVVVVPGFFLVCFFWLSSVRCQFSSWEKTIFVAPILHYHMVIPRGFATESSSSFQSKVERVS